MSAEQVSLRSSFDHEGFMRYGLWTSGTCVFFCSLCKDVNLFSTIDLLYEHVDGFHNVALEKYRKLFRDQSGRLDVYSVRRAILCTLCCKYILHDYKNLTHHFNARHFSTGLLSYFNHHVKLNPELEESRPVDEIEMEGKAVEPDANDMEGQYKDPVVVDPQELADKVCEFPRLEFMVQVNDRSKTRVSLYEDFHCTACEYSAGDIPLMAEHFRDHHGNRIQFYPGLPRFKKRYCYDCTECGQPLPEELEEEEGLKRIRNIGKLEPLSNRKVQPDNQVKPEGKSGDKTSENKESSDKSDEEFIDNWNSPCSNFKDQSSKHSTEDEEGASPKKKIKLNNHLRFLSFPIDGGFE